MGLRRASWFIPLLLALAGCHRGSLLAYHGKPLPPEQSAPAAAPVTPQICIAAMNRRVPVIMYHDVVKSMGPGSVFFDLRQSEFMQQMQYLQDHNITPITLDQLYAHLSTGADIPERSVVLTFDDNYQGFFDNAYPILKQFHYPAAMFVHTNFVGDQTGSHPKMTWDELKQLNSEGLVTIGAHTESHPENLDQLPEDVQKKEIVGSKEVLEKHLGIPINYFAYPNGKYIPVTRQIVRDAGFKLAFTMDHGLAEESEGPMRIHRYAWEKFYDAFRDQENVIENGPAAVVEGEISSSPVKLTTGIYAGLKISMVTGGTPTTVLSGSRETVDQIINERGGVAGINGTFFAMAAIASKSNVMIGPVETGSGTAFTPETSPYLLTKLTNRPVVIWGPKKFAIFNFQPSLFNTEAPYKEFMPDMTDEFVGGAWAIHAGVAMTDEQMSVFGSSDLKDPRRRALFGWNAQGQPVLVATLQTCTTGRAAEAAAAAGVQEAVLLDSGFSTSLIYNGRVIVTGHTSVDLASRPVPHAIVLLGQLDTTGADVAEAAAKEGAIAPYDIEGPRRARKKKVKPQGPAAEGTGVDAGDTGGGSPPDTTTGGSGDTTGTTGAQDTTGTTGNKGSDTGTSGTSGTTGATGP